MNPTRDDSIARTVSNVADTPTVSVSGSPASPPADRTLRQDAGPETQLEQLREKLASLERENSLMLQNADRFRLLAERAPDLVMLVHADGRRLYVSPSYYRVTGWTVAELESIPWRSRVHPDDKAAVEQARTANLRGDATRIDHRVLCRDGSWIWVETCCDPIVGADGRVETLVVWSRDITARKAAEAARHESELRFRRIYENALAGIAIIDLNGRLLECNTAYCRLLGATQDELRQSEFTQRVHPDDWDANREWDRRLLAGEIGSFEIETRYIRRDGEPVWVRKYVSLLPDSAGRPAYVMVMAIDASERRAAERELREREQRLSAVLQAASDAIITINRSGIIESANAAAERMFGYTTAELLGRNVKLLLPSPYREEHDEYMARYLRTGEARIIGVGREVFGQRKDGTVFPIDLAISEIDETQQFTGVMRDLSERKALQEQLVTIATEEQQRIARDLHDDLGQQLFALSMTAQTLAEAAQQTPATRSGEVWSLASRLTEGLQHCLEQVRELAHGLDPFAIETQGLPCALSHLAAQMSALHHLECEFAQPADFPECHRAVATQLYRIAQEAVANAVRHARARRIQISLEACEGLIRLEVGDDGAGIPEPPVQEGMGLRTMRYRASLIGARLIIASGNRGGTVVSCVLNQKLAQRSDSRKESADERGSDEGSDRG